MLDELKELTIDLPTQEVDPPIIVIAAGGNTMTCLEKVCVDLQIVTAAGPLELVNIECLVIDAPEEELLLGRILLYSQLELILMVYLSSWLCKRLKMLTLRLMIYPTTMLKFLELRITQK